MRVGKIVVSGGREANRPLARWM